MCTTLDTFEIRLLQLWDTSETEKEIPGSCSSLDRKKVNRKFWIVGFCFWNKCHHSKYPYCSKHTRCVTLQAQSPVRCRTGCSMWIWAQSGWDSQYRQSPNPPEQPSDHRLVRPGRGHVLGISRGWGETHTGHRQLQVFLTVSHFRATSREAISFISYGIIHFYVL